MLCTRHAYAGRLGYALGRYEHLPEPERLARARTLADLAQCQDPPDILDPREWEALRTRSRTTAASAAVETSAREASAIGAWLQEHALADAPPADAIARLLTDPEALERLRSTPA